MNHLARFRAMNGLGTDTAPRPSAFDPTPSPSPTTALGTSHRATSDDQDTDAILRGLFGEQAPNDDNDMGDEEDERDDHLVSAMPSIAGAPSVYAGLPRNRIPMQAPTRQQRRQQTQQSVPEPTHSNGEDASDVAETENAPTYPHNPNADPVAHPDFMDDDEDEEFIVGELSEDEEISDLLGDPDDGPCYGCKYMNSNYPSIRNTRLSELAKALSSPDAMHRRPEFYVALANQYDKDIRQPTNRHVRHGEIPLPEFTARKIYDHIHSTSHQGDNDMRLCNNTIHRLESTARSASKNGLVLTHRTKRRRDGRRYKQIQKETMLIIFKCDELTLKYMAVRSKLPGMSTEAAANSLSAPQNYSTSRLAATRTHNTAAIESNTGGRARKKARIQ